MERVPCRSRFLYILVRFFLFPAFLFPFLPRLRRGTDLPLPQIILDLSDCCKPDQQTSFFASRRPLLHFRLLFSQKTSGGLAGSRFFDGLCAAVEEERLVLQACVSSLLVFFFLLIPLRLRFRSFLASFEGSAGFIYHRSPPLLSLVPFRAEESPTFPFRLSSPALLPPSFPPSPRLLHSTSLLPQSRSTVTSKQSTVCHAGFPQAATRAETLKPSDKVRRTFLSTGRIECSTDQQSTLPYSLRAAMSSMLINQDEEGPIRRPDAGGT